MRNNSPTHELRKMDTSFLFHMDIFRYKKKTLRKIRRIKSKASSNHGQLNIKLAFRQSNNKVEMKQFPMETSLLFGVQEATVFNTPGLLSSKNVILRQALH